MYLSDGFYFYPLHLRTRSGSGIHWADGIYSNQVKLIENIASQLPPGIMLYVKDHPHLMDIEMFWIIKCIQDIPNVKLQAPHLPGKKIVK
jgi:hypothetical protein